MASSLCGRKGIDRAHLRRVLGARPEQEAQGLRAPHECGPRKADHAAGQKNLTIEQVTSNLAELMMASIGDEVNA